MLANISFSTDNTVVIEVKGKLTQFQCEKWI
jgi:hypothetical protein